MKRKALVAAAGHPSAARPIPVRVQNPRAVEGAPAEEHGSLLASRAFWVGGLFSVAVWAGVVYLIRQL